MTATNKFLRVLTFLFIALFVCQFSFSQQLSEKENFHLYLLIGQSNMAGRGVPSEIDKTPHPRVLVFSKDEKWEPAKDPLHFDKPTMVGVGPGLTFGKTMAEANPDVVIGLIPCAVGGSPIETWEPKGYHKQTDSHPYGDAMARCRTALDKGVLKGILWHQGEGDSNEERGPLYKERLKKLIERLRKELNAPSVPFIAGGLADPFVAKKPESKYIHEAFRDLSKEYEEVSFVSSKGLKCKSDGVHFNTESARELGRRYAKEMIRIQKAMSKFE